MKKEISIVSIGGWNAKVYSPKTVAKEVFNLQADGKMGININKDTLEFQFEKDGIAFKPGSNSIELISSNVNSASLFEPMDRYFKNAFRLQSWAPFVAYGYNIKFIMNKNEFSLLPFASIANNISLAKGYGMRKLEFKNQRIGIILTFANNNYTINFNLETRKVSEKTLDENFFFELNEEVKKIMGDNYGLQ